MASPHFMQLYVADFLADTQHLTTEEIGAYLLILMTMWRAGGSLPMDMKTMSRSARLSGRSWRNVWSHLSPLFTITGGVVTQKRLSHEFDKAMQKSALRSQSGARGGAAKALKYKDQAVAKATVLPQHSSDIRYYKEEKKEGYGQLELIGESAAPHGTSEQPLNPQKRGTRWLADREVPQDWIDSAMARRSRAGLPAIDLRAEIENFITYWPSVSGSKGLKIDWKLTFENSCLRARAPLGPYQKFGVVEGGAFEDTDLRGWTDRLKVFSGWYADQEDGSPKGSWVPKWGPQPGKPGNKVPQAAQDAFAALSLPRAFGGQQ